MNKNIKPVSSKTYVKNNCLLCPLCGSKEIVSTDGIDADGNIGIDNIQCVTCGSEWQDVYIVSKYINLNINKTERELKKIQEKAIRNLSN